MDDTDEGIVLTDREREALAGLAASIGDPWLAGQLAGGDRVGPRPRFKPTWGRRLPSRSGLLGVALFLAGAVLAVATFTRSTAVAALDLGLMGVGLWRFAVEHGDGLVRRWSARRVKKTTPQQGENRGYEFPGAVLG